MSFVIADYKHGAASTIKSCSQGHFETEANDSSSGPCGLAADNEYPQELRETVEPVKEAQSRLAEHLGQCHSLIDETKELALTVALRYGELIKQDIEKLFQEQLDKKKRSFDEKLQFEKDKNAKAAERVRQECQDRVNSAAATIKTYFIKQMESKDAQIYQLRSKIKELETCTSQERESKDKLKESQSQLDMRCSFCRRLGITSYVCSGCWLTFYCGEECQQLHWSEHAQSCSGASSYLDKQTMTSPRV